MSLKCQLAAQGALVSLLCDSVFLEREARPMGNEAVGNDAECEPQEILVITTWEDLWKIERMTKDVEVDNVKVGTIIGWYAIFAKEKRPCGIKQCHSPHFNGRIVELVDTRRCYIGINCGARYFPDWEEAQTVFAAKERVRRTQIQIEQAIDAAN
jgi:hypothetical protein